jgi:hypothetical protein
MKVSFSMHYNERKFKTETLEYFTLKSNALLRSEQVA